MKKIECLENMSRRVKTAEKRYCFGQKEEAKETASGGMLTPANKTTELHNRHPTHTLLHAHRT